MKTLQEMQSSLATYIPKKDASIFSAIFAKGYEQLAEFLYRSLWSDLTIKEMIDIIAAIENIKVKNYQFTSIIREAGLPLITDGFEDLKVSLPDNIIGDSLLQSSANIRKAQTRPLDPEKDKSFIATLLEVHKNLLEQVKKNFAKANNLDTVPVSQVAYSQEQINHSQLFADISYSTKFPFTTDKTNVLNDIRRGTVVLNGKRIRSDDEDIIKEIESLTGDRVEEEGSKANKIFNFGGQYLAAILVKEFKLATTVNDKHPEVQVCSGQLNWHKSKEDRIVVDITVNICSIKAEDEIFMMDASGEHLHKQDIDTTRGETLVANLKPSAEMRPSLAVPVSTISAQLELVRGKECKYHLEVSKMQIDSNARELQFSGMAPQLT